MQHNRWHNNRILSWSQKHLSFVISETRQQVHATWLLRPGPLVSNAERCRWYRERIKQDAQRYQAHKLRDKLRKRMKPQQTKS